MKKIISILLTTLMVVSSTTCIFAQPNDSINKTTLSFAKPVIYLDGYQGKDVTVKLDIVKGSTSMTYPLMTSQGQWKAKVESDGSINIDGKKYRYIFWEGDSSADTTWKFEKGFCIEGKNTINFLEEQLAKFALKDQEIQDFITYWAPQMIGNKYNVISFQTATYTDNVKLSVTPKPDKTLRVFMAWYPSNAKVGITEQSFKTPTRKGKVLVEWGGTRVDPATFKSVGTKTVVSDDKTTKEAENTKEAEQTTGTGLFSGGQQVTEPAVQQPVVQQPVDPYAQYGAYAQCAKDWDATAAKKCGQTWAQLDAATRQAAYNHWTGHGTNGW